MGEGLVPPNPLPLTADPSPLTHPRLPLTDDRQVGERFEQLRILAHHTQPPTKTSGIRLGTPAVTTRGMGGAEMEQTANWIAQVLNSPEDEALHHRVAEAVCQLCTRFPVPGHEMYERVDNR